MILFKLFVRTMLIQVILGSLAPRSPNLTGMGSNPDEEGSVCDHLAF